MGSANWIRVSQVAEELRLSSQAVRNLIRDGKLHGLKSDGLWLVDAASVERYLATHGPRPGASGDLTQLRAQVRDLSSAVDAAIRQADSSGADSRKVEQERDKHRADALTAKEVALNALATARATRSAMTELLEAMRTQEEALIQQLMPGSLTDELTATKRSD
jgi:excisionase family DNA binding protein